MFRKRLYQSNLFHFFMNLIFNEILGYVGKNGMTAAVCGDIFASPPSKHVSDAIEVVNEKGII